MLGIGFLAFIGLGVFAGIVGGAKKDAEKQQNNSATPATTDTGCTHR